MKKRLLRASVFLFATVTLFVRAAPPAADDAAPTASARQAAVLNVATYNLRVAHADDEKSGNGWGLRKPALRDVIQSIAPDILGTQEGNDRQLAELLPLLPGYACEKALYAGKKGNAHNCAILYKSSRFNLLDKGVFWLSPTPDTPSFGWDATDRRICFWVKLHDKVTDSPIFFFTAHFYYRYTVARRESGPLMVSKIKAIAGDAPVICTGDLNSTPKTSQMIALKKLLTDAHDAAPVRRGPENTAFHGGQFSGEPHCRIDYILVSKHFIPATYTAHETRRPDGNFPSDHLPVSATLEFRRPSKPTTD